MAHAVVKTLHPHPGDLAAMKIGDQQRGKAAHRIDDVFLTGAFHARIALRASRKGQGCTGGIEC